MSELPVSIQDVETPCLLVDIDRVKANCRRMRDRCTEMGVELRPHMKTHKTLEGAELMTDGSKRKIVVSTVAEAEFFAGNGYDDIIYASPMVKEKLTKRVQSLASRLADFHLMVDSVVGIDGIIETPLDGDRKWSVFVEIDCNYGRTGCCWDSEDVLTICKKAHEAANIRFQGLYNHCGNTYVPDTDKRSKIQHETVANLMAVKERLAAAGIPCARFGCGSTPSCSKPIQDMSMLTEFHPGNYIFYDYMQVCVGSCSLDDIAVKVAATVISHKPEVGTLVTDCGWLAIGQDGMEREPSDVPLGYTPVVGHPELRVRGMTQEIGKFEGNGVAIDYSKYPLGSRLYLYPFHSCLTAAQHPVYYVHSGDKIIGSWTPIRGW
ncbi:D-threo-3-hydroxyaspartate dehydratase-like [Dreissena polymorpha]|uniref:D-serine dehydratase n=1 Tax=Dreissena polymorpha TaxID=45954 RepID=A0A9D4F0K3_DREPO|nr:D-threo-3-hydroxyaspartate dehydratase-like [Dreissena polymorpha]XP_052226035.1 D-threo-3-hydroxyaspartate dehydratase-like [Dreissena polymorpha]XP_052226036.1 D-threo-3-hydroxyaspartate dehydratase-like [Dreissena polymorpha]XP_052226037.1 D-threo-3-hydroxyaspartate dehydratase-like [Dreissena polymorpha]XP_052226038.1 D-threo-3-hydroxyaspartate dehydratase-like [Dreissena polymorpha]XP_052226039.1 D-threo-3-hydroxyaspartate dehydratase-like [Dreissena polymorpha]XP_052226040.1 D-threo-